MVKVYQQDVKTDKKVYFGFHSRSHLQGHLTQMRASET